MLSKDNEAIVQKTEPVPPGETEEKEVIEVQPAEAEPKSSLKQSPSLLEELQVFALFYKADFTDSNSMQENYRSFSVPTQKDTAVRTHLIEKYCLKYCDSSAPEEVCLFFIPLPNLFSR